MQGYERIEYERMQGKNKAEGKGIREMQGQNHGKGKVGNNEECKEGIRKKESKDENTE